MKALVIVDVQNDFLPGGALAISGGDQIIDVINELQDFFPLVVATKDWHPPHHVSFASSHGKKPGEMIEIQGRKQELWPDHCVQNTQGADFHKKLRTQRIQHIFFKGNDPSIDSYSAFYDNGHLRSTGLGECLQAQSVTHLYIAGLATDYCVKYSVLDARQLGLQVNVIVDACRGIELQPGDIDQALHIMQKAGASLTDSSKIKKEEARVSSSQK